MIKYSRFSDNTIHLIGHDRHREHFHANENLSLDQFGRACKRIPLWLFRQRNKRAGR